jgi:hypothetical protein
LLAVLSSLEPLPQTDLMPEITEDDLVPLDDVDLDDVVAAHQGASG